MSSCGAYRAGRGLDIDADDGAALDAYVDFCARALVGGASRGILTVAAVAVSSGRSKANGVHVSVEGAGAKAGRVVEAYFPLEIKRASEPAWADFGPEWPEGGMTATAVAEDSSDGQHVLADAGRRDVVIYTAADVLGEVGEEYGLLVRRAAQWAGVDDQDVHELVETYLRRLVRLREPPKRRK